MNDIARLPLDDLLLDAVHSIGHSGRDITRIVGGGNLPLDPSRAQGVARMPEPLEMVDLIGAYLFLCSHSNPHHHYQMGLIENRLLPSLEWNSFRLYLADDLPVAFVNWTWVTDVVDARLSKGESALSPEDWHKGEHMWFMEILAPFGHSLEVMSDLHDQVFSTHPSAKATIMDDNGGIKAVRHYRPMVG
ncbi:toxin-activating lysine-acyltransferase [Aestuariispira insulae]|uniref:RTX toxin-activating lysine-acyltransferase n=1 Tax=Aestuariispira insulae TaxID=1461337 RepID=A0A3D9HV15_9PROT|nr:toxin-activating lysine-acyltransferase [Aestuariispira insulae]RED53221.1 hemolysin-activating ACP:hemolysin acyltransferase [Aestuariispira insulae]